MNFMSNTVPFFNAMIAGSDRFYRGLMNDPTHRASTAIKTGMLGMGSMALYMLNRTIPEYADLPDWDKWGNWHFFIPKYDDEGNRLRNPDGTMAHNHFKMPKLWEVGLVASLSERTLESGLGDDEDGDLWQDVGQMIASNFGLNLMDRGFPLPLPVGIDILTEQWSNRINFTGNPIETAGMHNHQVWERKRADQPKIFGEWGKLVRDAPVFEWVRSPARAEALLRGIYGEWAMIGAHIADSVFYPGGPSMHIDELPVVRRGYERWGKYSKHGRDFYERLETFTQTANTFRSAAMNPSMAKVFAEMADDKETMGQVAFQPMLERTSRAIGEINKTINLLRSGDYQFELSGDEIRERIDELTRTKRLLQKRVSIASRDMLKKVRNE